MKVLRLTPHYYFDSGYWPSRYDPLGGMQVQITNTSTWLANHGVDQDVLTTGYPEVPRLISEPLLRVHSIRKVTLPIKSEYDGTLFLNESWALGVLNWIYTRHKHCNYDLLHVHASGVSAPLWIASKVQSLLKNIPLILTIHCSRLFTYSPMNRFDLILNNWVKSLELKAVRNSTKIILLSKQTQEKFLEKFPESSHKFLRIGDCLSQQHAIHKKGLCCEKFYNAYIKRKEKIITYVGRIAHEKGWKTFVKMAFELRNQENLLFLICGDGPQLQEMIAMVDAYHLKDSFIFTGFISNSSIACALSNSFVLVIPSIHEEFGGTFLEGINANVPIVASKVGGLKENLQHNRHALLVKVEDYQGFASSIMQLINNPYLRSFIVSSARNEVVPSFNPDKTICEIYNCYKEVLHA